MSMVAYQWIRGHTLLDSMSFTQATMATIPRGSTLNRVRFGWSWAGSSSTLYSVANILDTKIAAGVVTGYPATSYSAPDPLTGMGDVAPPLERWLWWEVRWPVPVTWGTEHDDVVLWRDSGAVEPGDSHGQVTASTPVGANLGVYFVWNSSRSDWPAIGYTRVSAWWSVLYST